MDLFFGVVCMILNMANSKRTNTVSSVCLTITPGYIHGEGEDSMSAPCYDEFHNNNLPNNKYSHACYTSNNVPNDNWNKTSNNNIYESLKTKKRLSAEFRQHRFSDNSWKPLSKQQTLKQLLHQVFCTKRCFIFRHRGKICLIMLLLCIIQYAVMYHQAECSSLFFIYKEV